ncbi:MAG: methyltransferase domain-containing protein [bacterium]|nr:methyltransferase domain-containing protein [bacterium]
MSASGGGVPGVDRQQLREAIQREYEQVARNPDQGFHFHTGRALARIVGYQDAWLEGIPETAIESFAGTGNPFAMGLMKPGERVVDVGSGAGIDSLIAAKQVGDEGEVVGVDMTPGMLDRARRAASQAGAQNVEFREGHMEALPFEDAWADVIISNGVLNLAPDKNAVLQEFERVLGPNGRLQIADILVTEEVPDAAKQKIDLWTG